MKAQITTNVSLLFIGFAIGMSTPDIRAFSLLGPNEPWMEFTNGFRQPSMVSPPVSYAPGSVQPADIGGPMDITNEYRWNVPVITYGFDQSFLNYFGTNGVAAVESAIQILNSLPPVSQIVLTNYPLNSQQFNSTIQAENLLDLKSTTLSLLLEQLGLAQPTRCIYVLNGWDPSLFNYQQQSLIDIICSGLPPNFQEYDAYNEDPNNHLTNFLTGNNFDPETFAWSLYVNGAQFGAEVRSYFSPIWGMIQNITPFPIDPLASIYPAVADKNWISGGFYTGLTYDDIGGLCYLYSTNNENYETLLPGVFGAGTNVNSFVNGAYRPGVDKITFVLQPVDSFTGAFLPMTNQFTDVYVTNGVLQRQQLARLVSQPDILFSAKDMRELTASPDVSRTGTTNWINNAALNGNLTGAGPGLIQPPITITFNKAGRQYMPDDSGTDESVWDNTFLWGTFDGSTNAPLVYPILSASTNQMIVRMLLQTHALQRTFEWALAGSTNSIYNFQTSTNLSDWVSLFAVTNNGVICDFLNLNPSSVVRFYRLVPQ